MHLRAFSCFPILLFAICHPLSAQERTAGGYSPVWERQLTEQREVLIVNGRALQGWGFVAYETTASDALGYWKAYMKTLGGRSRGNRPAEVTGANVPGLGLATQLIYAEGKKENTEGGVRITVAFAVNDSTAAPEAAGMQDAVHQMSVAVNRAVVRSQVDMQEDILKKSSAQVADAQREKQKDSDRAERSRLDLKKIQDRQVKLQRKQTALQRDAEKLQTQLTGSSDARTLKKMGKNHQKLADVEKDMAREQQRAEEAQARADKQQDQAPEEPADEHTDQQKKEAASSELEALKSKLAAIR